jgi:hypothetical protein
MKLQSKEFYEVMNSFETVMSKIIRTGSQGFTRADKQYWVKNQYYNCGIVNEAFITYMNGYMAGRLAYMH